MRRTLVRYKAKPDLAGENQRLIEGVFRELAAKSLVDVRYLVLLLTDDTFVHIAEATDGAPAMRHRWAACKAVYGLTLAA